MANVEVIHPLVVSQTPKMTKPIGSWTAEADLAFVSGQHFSWMPTRRTEQPRVLRVWSDCAAVYPPIDGALARMSESVSWPKASEGGRVVGKEEIRAY